MRHTLLFILFGLLLSSCMPPRVTPEKLHAHYQAHAMDKFNQMSYMGTKGRYHYFHHFRLSMMKREYRVLKDELFIKNQFPLTDDQSQWCPYMVVEDESRNGGFALISYRNISRNFGDGPPLDRIVPSQP